MSDKSGGELFSVISIKGFGKFLLFGSDLEGVMF